MRHAYGAVPDAVVVAVAGAKVSAGGMAEGNCAASTTTVRVEVDPVGDSAESGAATTTVRVVVAVRPNWSVAT